MSERRSRFAALTGSNKSLARHVGEVAGAGVADHYHLHIVPRWSGDSNFMTVTAKTRLVPEELDATFDKLLPHFSELSQEPFAS